MKCPYCKRGAIDLWDNGFELIPSHCGIEKQKFEAGPLSSIYYTEDGKTVTLGVLFNYIVALFPASIGEITLKTCAVLSEIIGSLSKIVIYIANTPIS